MKSKIAAFALAATMMTQLGVGAFADAGPLTSSGNPVWTVVSFPLRLVSGTTGLALGALGGGFKGIVHTEQKFASNTFGKAEENPFLVPVGLVGTVVAIPVGFVTGAPEGAVTGGQYGYSMWDHF